MIDILLSTYNGASYIEDQLNSIIEQTDNDWTLLIRDDNSKDNTVSILRSYVDKYPEKIKLVSDNKTENIGPIRSFEFLLNQSQADYIMFCDQDDIWLPEKISLTKQEMLRMESINKDIPLLVYTDLIVVNENRKVLFDSFWSYAGLYPQLASKNIYYLAIRNCVTGCTTMINKKAKEISLPFVYPLEMHDAWVAINTMKYGKISYIKNQTIEYRQHGSNVCGAQQVNMSISNKIQNLKRIIDANIANYKFYYPLVYKSVFQYLLLKIKFYINVRWIM
jgi:glycosyltransferase involved in cell wall biosynthesis